MIQRSFASGEVAPALYPRTDLSKYRFGLRTCRNAYVMRSGGVQNRPGFEFIGAIKDSTKNVRLIDFIPSDTVAFVLELGDYYCRFIYNGGYIYEPEKVISGVTIVSETSVSLTCAGHGYTEGEEIYVEGIVGVADLNYRNFKIGTVANANTFEIEYMDDTNITDVTGTWTSGGTCKRMYEITTPYAHEDVSEIQYAQNVLNPLEMILVHGSYKPQRLTYISDTSWTMADADLEDLIPAPTTITVGTAGTGDYWVVTSVEEETYEESVASAVVSWDTTATAVNYATITITEVEGATEYNIYKKINGVYGYIGTAGDTGTGTTIFYDNGIIPDTSETPPLERDLTSLLGEDFHKLTNPSTLPDGNATCVAWSPSGTYLAVGHATSQYLTLYSQSGTTFTKLTDPSTPPTGTVNGLSWSPDEKYLAVAHTTTPFVSIYSRSGTTFTKVANPSALPPGNGLCCAWTPTGQGLFVGCDTDPYYSYYGFNGTTFAQKTNIFPVGMIPYGAINGCSFSPVMQSDGTYCEFAIAVAAIGTGNYLKYYCESYITYADAVNYPSMIQYRSPVFLTGVAKGCSFSPNGRFLAIAHDTSPYVTVYDYGWTLDGTLWVGGNPRKISDPTTPPTGIGFGVSWGPNSDMFSVAHTTSPYVTSYFVRGITAPTLEKMDNPSTLPTGNGKGTAWYPSGRLMAVAHTTTPFVSIYQVNINNPSVISYYQQRLILAATNAEPTTVWTSRTGLPENFTISNPILDDDSLLFRMASKRQSKIMHAVGLRKLALLTYTGEWTAEGGEDGILRPGEINLKQQSYYGASSVHPVVSGDTLIYTQSRNTKLYDFFEYDYGYDGSDLTTMAYHLFDGYTIVDMALQQNPHNILWVVRSDGMLLGLTLNRKDKIAAWHKHDTDGDFLDICVVPESGIDSVYIVVEREIDGSTVRYIERMSNRDFSDIIDLKLLDCHLTYDGRNDETVQTVRTMTLSGGTNWTYDEDLTLTASSAYFASTDVGNEIHLTGPAGNVIRCEITAYTSTTVVTVRSNMTVPAAMRNSALETWSKAVDEITGLWHLEGEEVSVFADGFVVASPNNTSYTAITVASGVATLPRCYSVVHVGLPYLSDLETLDVDTVEGDTIVDRKKIVKELYLHVESTRGIWAGPEPPSDDDSDPLENLRELKPRRLESTDDPVELKTEVVDLSISGTFSDGGRVFVRQVEPVPMTILAIAPMVKVGG